jgi:hypothetical protein
MGIKTLISPTCKELAQRLSSGAYEKASWLEKLAVRWHLFRCELCRVYARQVELLGEAYRSSSRKAAADATDLKSKLTKRLKGGE